LRFGQTARTPPVALTFVNPYGDRLASCDLRRFAHDIQLCSLLVFSDRMRVSDAVKPFILATLPTQIEGISRCCQNDSESKAELIVAYYTTIALIENGRASIRFKTFFGKMGYRGFTRLIYAFSKKLERQTAAAALCAMHVNADAVREASSNAAVAFSLMEHFGRSAN
jgi:hypothetical protein